MLISPRREWQTKEILAKSIVFVLDTSGSREGAKMAQAREALKTFLGSLGAEDRFDVVPFSTEPEPFFGQRVPASAENVAEALQRVERVTAAGGTNIHAALEVALRDQENEGGRVPIVVFLTDGEPTVGEVVPENILAAARTANQAGSRVFVFGVGDQVNTHLLDSLAEQHGGARDYVRETERIDEKTRALFAKLSHPVMTDLALTVDGLTPTKVVPAKLPDLFAGDRLEVLGRFAGGGVHAIRLTGTVGGERREYVYEGRFAEAPAPDFAFVAPLWAERRVGLLLDALRLNGANPELVAEVERLGREYRIVTPYTSHLVVEPNLRRFAQTQGAPGGAPAGRFRGPGDTTPPGAGSGGGAGGGGLPVAVPPGSTGPSTPGAGAPSLAAREQEGLRALGYDGDDANDTSGFFLGHGDRDRRASRVSLEDLAVQLSREGVLPEAEGEELSALAVLVARELRDSEQRLRVLGKSTSGATAVDESQYLAGLMAGGRGDNGRLLLELFTRRAGDKTFVLRKGIWVDQACGETPPAERRRIEAFSPEYFQLLTERPALGAYLALSTRLILRVGDEVLEIHEPAPEVQEEPATTER
jgi:Ca-activated chloride channel family protein